MKKKVLTLIMVACMLGATMVGGCGKKEETNSSNTTTETAEVTVTPTETPEPTATPEPTSTPTPTPEPVDTRFEDGVAKVERMLEAYNTLLDQDLIVNNYIQEDTECLVFNCQVLEDLVTADGIRVVNSMSIYSACITYYNHYVNENGEYYDLQAWIAEQPNNQYLYDLYFADYSLEDYWYVADILLFDAIGLMPNFEEYGFTAIELVDSTDYEVSHITSSYVIKLESNGDPFVAIFDEEDNLLNICPEDSEWNGYICSFGW